MDAAYDHIQEESLPADDRKQEETAGSSNRQSKNFNAEFQDAYKAISSSPWAAKLGGFFGTVVKQGEQVYQGAQKEYTAASEQASKGLSSILSRTRGLSLAGAASAGEGSSTDTEKEKDGDTSAEKSTEKSADVPESLPADIIKEAGQMFSVFRTEASKRLKDIEKAEDAADEALLRFGTNMRNFLRDAVTIAAPTESEGGEGGSSQVLFESKDAEGKRVIHTSRFDAQLHVIHSSLESFQKDPDSPEWAGWAEKFDVNAKTEAIAKDLDQYEELRKVMEKLVPEKVDYAQFWTRYYFLRHVVEADEQKRKETLKASAAAPAEEEVAWDEDSSEEESGSEEEEEEEEEEGSEEEEDDDDEDDDDDSSTSTPNPNLAASKDTLKPVTAAPQATPQATPQAAPSAKAAPPSAAAAAAATTSPRRSADQHSQPDSDASYDLVSGATTRTAGSPQNKVKQPVAEESDEEDWE